jgi:hypothetical protein
MGLAVGTSLMINYAMCFRYGYWAPYLFDLDDTDPGCGIEDFNKV